MFLPPVTAARSPWSALPDSFCFDLASSLVCQNALIASLVLFSYSQTFNGTGLPPLRFSFIRRRAYPLLSETAHRAHMPPHCTRPDRGPWPLWRAWPAWLREPRARTLPRRRTARAAAADAVGDPARIRPGPT